MTEPSKTCLPCPEVPTPAVRTRLRPFKAAGRVLLAKDHAYGWPFWMAYGANASMVAAFNLLHVRYGVFVESIHPAQWEWWLGWIVGVGGVGALLVRLAQGVAIDQYGARRIWLWSISVYVISCLLHLVISGVGPGVFALRIVLNTALAGAFGASMVNISRRASPERMTEMIATLGTSGFVGIIAGAHICDGVYAWAEHLPGNTLSNFSLLVFPTSAVFATLAGIFAALATSGQTMPVATRRRPPLTWLLRRYQPGAIMIMGVVAGAGISVPMSFLVGFTSELGFERISWFFDMYAITALVTRLILYRVTPGHAVRKIALFGGFWLIASYFLYLSVQVEWQLIFPALAAGIAHAAMFPAVVGGGSSVFPDRYRGIGTSLMLGCFDFGTVVGPAFAGILLDASRSHGWSPYPTLFITVASLLTIAVLAYASLSYRRPLPVERLAQPPLSRY